MSQDAENTIMEKPDTSLYDLIQKTEEHVFDNQKILTVFRDYFDKSNKLVVDLDMVYYPSNDVRIANQHVVKIRTIPFTEDMRMERDKQVQRSAEALQRVHDQLP